MVLRRITLRLKKYKESSCTNKSNYNYFHALYRRIFVKLRKNINLKIYKCLFGNHYHIGHVGNQTKDDIRYASKKAKLSLLYQGANK